MFVCFRKQTDKSLLIYNSFTPLCIYPYICNSKTKVEVLLASGADHILSVNLLPSILQFKYKITSFAGFFFSENLVVF